jgi:hypothetical protein
VVIRKAILAVAEAEKTKARLQEMKSTQSTGAF